MIAKIVISALVLWTLLIQPGLTQGGVGLDSNDVKEATKRYVCEMLGQPEGNVLIEYQDTRPLFDDKVVFDQVKILPGKGQVRKGLQYIQCALLLESKLVQNVRLRVKVRTFELAVVSADRIARHSVLQSEQLKLVRRETTQIKQKIHTSIKALLGLRTTRLINAGEILTADLVESLPLISRGDAVEIQFKKGALNITMPGLARQEGRFGDEIRVKCLENRKIFRAEILDAKSVIVNL